MIPYPYTFFNIKKSGKEYFLLASDCRKTVFLKLGETRFFSDFAVEFEHIAEIE